MSALDAVAYCHLGSSRAPYPRDPLAFAEAERNGLLKHHPVWHATERGIGALIAAGLLAGEPAPETSRLHILWARHADGDTCAHYAQFVAAFTDGLVDCWPSAYAREREDAESAYRDAVAPSRVTEFFTTVADLPRPDLESRARDPEAVSALKEKAS